MISFLVLIITKQQKEQIAEMENISQLIIYWEMHKCNNGIFGEKKLHFHKILCHKQDWFRPGHGGRVE